MNLKVTVDWMERWANRPRFVLHGFPISKDGWPEMNWELKNGLHRRDVGEQVYFFYTDGKPTEGFGGAIFEGYLADGTHFRYAGAWSSRAGCVNQLWPHDKVVDVTQDYSAFHVKDSTIIDWWREHKDEVDWGLAWVKDTSGEIVLEPTRDGKLKNEERERIESIAHIV